jgi:hypothetical protein
MTSAQIVAREPTEEELAYEYPKPERSLVLVQIIKGENSIFTRYNRETRRYESAGLEFHEIFSLGGSADIESENGMLGDAVAPMLEPEYWQPGWYVIEDFYGYYSRDYYGEVDVDYECGVVRLARWSDVALLMGENVVPVWARIAMRFGRDFAVPALWMDPGPIWETLSIWWTIPVSRVGQYV